MKVIGYEAKCKVCGWVFEKSKTPTIKNMPAKCGKCDKDMAMIPVFDTGGKDLSFEITIFCKETGGTLRSSFLIGYEKVKDLTTCEIENMFQNDSAETFLRMICATKDSKDTNKIKQLFNM